LHLWLDQDQTSPRPMFSEQHGSEKAKLFAFQSAFIGFDPR
jgi:hypothetical protein